MPDINPSALAAMIPQFRGKTTPGSKEDIADALAKAGVSVAFIAEYIDAVMVCLGDTTLLA